MPQDNVEDTIQRLLSQNEITHIITGAGERPLTGRALVQRCLSAGIENPLALPDGTVAARLPEGVPATLPALELTACSIEAGPSETPSDGAPDDRARLAAIDAAIQELEARIGRDLAAVSGRTADHARISGDVLATPETDDAAVGASAPEETAHATAEPLILTAASSANAAVDEVPEADLHDPDEAPIELSFLPDAPSPDPRPGNEMIENDTPADVPVSSEIAPEPQAIEEADTTAASDADIAEALIAPVLARVADLEAMIAGQVDQLAGLAAAVETIAKRPAPRADMTEANRAVARFATAFAHGLSRLEHVSDRLEAVPEPAPSIDPHPVLAEIGAGIANLAAALAETPRGNTGGPELEHLMSLQTVMIRQLSAILDAQRPTAENAVGEFLADLRHSVAEIAAEHTQTARAS